MTNKTTILSGEKIVFNIIAITTMIVLIYSYVYEQSFFSNKTDFLYILIPFVFFLLVGRLIFKSQEKEGQKVRPGFAIAFGLLAAISSYLLLLLIFELL